MVVAVVVKDVILAMDQGTTGSTVVFVDRGMNVLAKINREFPQHFPQPGWVEHNPEEIWESIRGALRDAINSSGIDVGRIAGIGITNQRETSILWDRSTGAPVCNAIVWQDRRTAPFCEQLKKKGLLPKIRRKTGLVLDPYFSATKIRWMLDHHPNLRKRAEQNEIAFGTVDSYLVCRLTGGKSHVTDVSNGSRTLLMNLETLDWDPELMKIFRIPPKILPQISSSSEVYGHTQGVEEIPDGIPVCGIAGDQQAALFGQACFQPGEAKCTYGTGSFLLMNTGKRIVRSRHGMLTSVAWRIKGKVSYCLEGSAFIAGAAVQWLRDSLRLLHKSSDVEELARSVPDSGGVVFVPAFVGLGAPYWNPAARGLIAGISRGTTSAHIARATLEGIAYLQYDILQAMQKDLGKKLRILRVDGGASRDNLLMQFQSDILGVELSRPQMVETTALGAAFLAGLAIGLWRDQTEIATHWKEDRRFIPTVSKHQIRQKIELWHAAVKKA